MKTFVLDTNVLLHNAESIESFADNGVVIPMAVIEELDKFKGNNDELGRNARQVIRRLDTLRRKGSLKNGVPLQSGGTLRILSLPKNAEDNSDLLDDIADNRILRVAWKLHNNGSGPVIFVSKDINARLKADAMGIQAQDFEKQKVNFDELYSGFAKTKVAGELVDKLIEERRLKDNSLDAFFPNQFVKLIDEKNETHSAMGRITRKSTIETLPIEYERVWNINARNMEQRAALELLMDPAILVVTMVGQAGTGKTLLALAAALHCTLKDHSYDKILVSRPIIPMGKDIGYLPGDKDAKLTHWMQPIFDNLLYLLREETETNTKTRRKVKFTGTERINELLKDGIIELEALTYIRGRTIPGQYVIIDEAQNLTPHEVKTIISRAGEGTKMVLTGDPNQIDNPYLDSSSNGLTYTAEHLKDRTIHGHVTLRTSERSELAGIAAACL